MSGLTKLCQAEDLFSGGNGLTELVKLFREHLNVRTLALDFFWLIRTVSFTQVTPRSYFF